MTAYTLMILDNFNGVLAIIGAILVTLFVLFVICGEFKKDTEQFLGFKYTKPLLVVFTLLVIFTPTKDVVIEMMK